jgi:hypothetical protein
MSGAERRAQLLAIWLERPEDERTAETDGLGAIWVQLHRIGRA